MKLVELIRTPVMMIAGYFTFTAMRAAEYSITAAAGAALGTAILTALAVTLAYFALGGE